MLRKSRHKLPAKYGNVTVFIDGSSEMEGKHTFAGTVLMNGKLRGEMTTTGALIVDENGVVNGIIRAQSVIVRGEVLGRVEASERVELNSPARVFADLEAPVVVIEDGAFFEGQCRTTKARPDVRAPDGQVVPVEPDQP